MTATPRTTAEPSRRHLLTLGGAGLVAAVPLAATATSAEAAGPLSTTDVARFVHAGINAQRRKAGLAALTRDPAIDQVAQAWTQHMADSNQLVHNPDVWNQIPQGWRSAAENIAYNQGRTAKKVAAAFVKQWMNSEGHRANILNGAYNRTGVGIAVSGDRIYATQDFGQY